MRHAAPYLVMMLHVLPAAAQQPLETKLVIQQGGRETGREEFTLRQSRARGLPGTTIIAAARYPAAAPTTQLAATLERTPEPLPIQLDSEVERTRLGAFAVRSIVQGAAVAIEIDFETHQVNRGMLPAM